MQSYEDEQAQLKSDMETLESEIKAQVKNGADLESFIEKIQKYSDLQELTPYALRELISAIYVEAPTETNGKRHQNIRIEYDFIGLIPLEELRRQEAG